MGHLRSADFMRELPVFVVLCFASVPARAMAEPLLSPRNLEAPFPYVAGGSREWPILERAVPGGTSIKVVTRDGDALLDGEQLASRGLIVAVTADGRLRVAAKAGANARLRVEVVVSPRNGVAERQTLEVRPAPPDRPISYYADFGDDLIRIFMNSTSGQFSPVTKAGFDQYFRRLQAHGTRRLIVWLSPFPYIADAKNYAPEDWLRYERQARAILDDEPLSRVLKARTGFASWSWLRALLATRLNPEFGRMLGQSAADHGIRLTVCFRPFEAALTKYYAVPAFDQDGTYLWEFLPLASPTINGRSDQVGWRHYRDVLREIGHADAAELSALELPGVTDGGRFAGRSGLRVVASPFPPLADDSFVLVRESSGAFQLRPFATLRDAADAKRVPLDGIRIQPTQTGLCVTGVSLPRGCRYLIVSWADDDASPDLSALSPVVLRAKGGNRLGRETTYWVQGSPTDPSRVAGITADGEYWAEFQASEASQRSVAAGPERLSLAGRQLVVDLGADATVEMIDFNQPLARQNAVREIATVLQQPPFDDILINTRSHVDLPVSLADGDQGTRPVGLYWHERRGPRMHLGLDKAYLPRSEASFQLVRELSRQPDGVEQITTWQPDEWRDECQTLQGPRWRYARNRGTADGLRLLLQDLEQAFPGRRIRMLVPPSEPAAGKVRSGLDSLPQPAGGPYGRGFYDKLWPSSNYIPAVGEGAAMVDLRGLSVEPAFLGSGGYLPGMTPFQLYVRECLADLADNRGSSFRGPRSYFFEAQTTLQSADLAAARRSREEMVCHLLAQRTDIGEIILYEAADWLYFFPLSDPGLCGHNYLDRCGQP
ncbi:MAG: hypothetical protein HUU20_12165 [Pirellulales bacterium]|nr:hypothetical protein [Pirellulales bacterium]